MSKIDLRPAKVELLIPQGDERQVFTATIKSNGVALDVHLDTFTSQVRRNAASTDVAATIVVSFVTDGINGQIAGHITDTDDLVAGYVWDCQWNRANGDRLTIMGGKVVASRDVTRA